MPKDKEKFKTKARYEISTIKLVFKIVKPLQKTIHKLIFSPPKLAPFMFPQVKTQFSLSQNNILVTETHLTVA